MRSLSEQKHISTCTTAGRDPAEAPTELWFELSTDGDLYGFWVVRLREYQGYFFLVEFRRIEQ
jgi:hypothetical protein